MTPPLDNLPRKVFTDPVHFLAFGFGSGLAPKAPGTVGTLPALALYWLLSDLPLGAHLAIVTAAFVAGIYLCGESARRLGVHDYGGIVWDEIVAMYVTLLVAPPTVLGWVAAFVLFRFFDIVKPWPIRDLDHRLGGGLGIMLDDLVAALYASVLLGIYGWLMT
jgi:phosphatidylglycerophosphatase A